MLRPWLGVHLLVVLMFHLSPIQARAQTTSSTTSASSASMAGSGRASVEASDVHELNPAMLVHLKNRDLHTSFTKDAWIVGITDNDLESIVPAGFSYTRVRSGEGTKELISKDLRLTLAGFLGKWVSFGVSGRQNEVELRGVSWKQVNADLGFSFIANRNFGLAAVFYDVMDGNREMPDAVRLRPRTGVGANYVYEDFMRFRLDVVSAAGNNFGRAATLLGYETELNDFVAFRLGAGDEPEYERQIGSLGVGLNLPRFRLNYAFQSGLKGEFENRHSVDLGIPF